MEIVAHLKGFASGINFNDENVQKHRDNLVDFLVGRKVTHLVWDADCYAKGSFTELIPYIHEATKDTAPLTMVTYAQNCDSKRKSIKDSWGKIVSDNNIDLDVRCLECMLSSEERYHDLGHKILLRTNASLVCSFGGGECVWQEFNLAREAGHNAEWIVWPVWRMKESQREDCLLYNEIRAEGGQRALMRTGPETSP